ncbi:MAG: glutamine--fructose-6-phosphate transaminase (isomerizing) [Bacteroidetes bacterium]|nr:glutamine--fructose-6-phosphate transaminase (isomerizing) [Bacteroidota bacterium]
MCGIVGYIGKKNATEVVLNGLQRVEYRGYDSTGIAFIKNKSIQIYKKSGRLTQLLSVVQPDDNITNVAIGHTRWATHGIPNDSNAHPHSDNHNNIAVVHNGIIENYRNIKTMLLQKGYNFSSDTDSEVLAVFISSIYDEQINKDITEATRLALAKVQGTFGLLVISKIEPNKIVCARRGSPLILGIGEDDNEFIVASDQTAIVDYTKKVIFIEDDEMVVISNDGYYLKTLDNIAIKTKETSLIEFELGQLEKGGFEHFMLKEIFEQPETIMNATRGRMIQELGEIKLGGLSDFTDILTNMKRIIIVACGTSWHSALIGEYLIESLARLPVEVEYASEFRYRNAPLLDTDLVIAISQSGETADTLEAIREVKRQGVPVIGIVNVVGSTIARETNAGVYLHAGPEIGVASTKAFTSQVMVLLLLSIHLGLLHNKLSSNKAKKLIAEINKLPLQINKILSNKDKIKDIAIQLASSPNVLYLGRGLGYPIAMEGALKLKEISYLHSEGMPAAEMKHGPIALIDKNMPVIVVAMGEQDNKIWSNVEEIRTRGGRIILIDNEGNSAGRVNKEDIIIEVPRSVIEVSAILGVIPLQLLSYYVANHLGREIDNPRNLAKAVTVE